MMHAAGSTLAELHDAAVGASVALASLEEGRQIMIPADGQATIVAGRQATLAEAEGELDGLTQLPLGACPELPTVDFYGHRCLVRTPAVLCGALLEKEVTCWPGCPVRLM
jgi:hypothetical protein